MKFPIFALTWAYKISKIALQQRNNGLKLSKKRNWTNCWTGNSKVNQIRYDVCSDCI